MTELEFAQRLKQYRKAKNLTQQELADRLGVSNKSVSRWESGSYPDVAILGPLAKALGVSVDDLLGESPPIRSLGQGDWQNLLSFAFAIGGGVLFFLLDLFTPTLLCYLLYLGSMAYGVYLQRHYTYHTRWFHAANLVMNFFVNRAAVKTLLNAIGMLSLSTLTGPVFQPRDRFMEALATGQLTQLCQIYLAYFLLSALPTAVTAILIQRYRGRRRALERSPITLPKALPALWPLLLLLYWLPFERADLPGWLYMHQTLFFHWGVATLAVLTLLLLWKRERHMLLPAGVMLACTLFYPAFMDVKVYSTLSRSFYDWREGMDHSSYIPFGQLAWGMAALAATLAVLYLLCCRWWPRLGWPEEDK